MSNFYSPKSIPPNGKRFFLCRLLYLYESFLVTASKNRPPAAISYVFWPASHNTGVLPQHASLANRGVRYHFSFASLVGPHPGRRSTDFQSWWDRSSTQVTTRGRSRRDLAHMKHTRMVRCAKQSSA